jgi:tetrahydromethanopterin S-methyltransferase subunit A
MKATLRRVEGLIQHATAAAKCHSCGCFQDSVSALEQTELSSDLAASIEKARATFLPREYDCIGCKVCWPADALNAASEIVELPAGAGCPTQEVRRRDGWPPFPGEYQVLRFAAPIAVCTLHSRELVQAVATASPEGVSVVGALQTENLGIERIIENVVSNPHIRMLLLCGEDTPGRIGHYPGQSLMSLVEKGIDAKGRIVGAKGKRPLLRNVDTTLIERFRSQVSILDARGEERVEEVVRRAVDAASTAPGPMAGTLLVERSVRMLPAQPPGQLTLDPAGYVVVIPDLRRQLLVAEHYENSGLLRSVIEGDEAVHVMSTLLGEGLVTRLDHAAYLGRELALAERSLHEGTPYHQDQAPEQTSDPGSCGCQSPHA